MLIKEYRIPMPMSVDEYRIAQLYMIQVSSRNNTALLSHPPPHPHPPTPYPEQARNYNMIGHMAGVTLAETPEQRAAVFRLIIPI